MVTRGRRKPRMVAAVLKVVAVSLYGTPHTLDWGSAVCNITLSQHNVGTIKVAEDLCNDAF